MAIILALTANIAFSFASTLFADFSKSVSAKWMNCFKLSIAFGCFGLLSAVLREHVTSSNILIYIGSGAIGLFVADHFLCEAFARIGSARSLMIFSFAPLFVATWCYFLFGDKLNPEKFIAIIFFMACVFTISFEKLKESGKWEIAGLLFALSGVLLDGIANVITSYGFRAAPSDGVFTVCALRTFGAFLAFMLFNPFLKVKLISNFKKLTLPLKRKVIIASVLGTFLSLSLWISAVKMGDLTSIVALSGITPVLASSFEVFQGKSKLSSYLLLALSFFLMGFYFLIRS